MPIPFRNHLFCAAALAVLSAGAAHAATDKLHTMKVDAPDGTVIHVQYSGDVAPEVRFIPADEVRQVRMPVVPDPFARMERISAIMEAQMQPMMMQRVAVLRQQAAVMQQNAIAAGAATPAPGLTLVGHVPEGVHVTYYSSTTSADGCTRTVSYSSNGRGTAPKIVQAASDACTGVAPRDATIPVNSPPAMTAPEVPGQTV
jgi:hypothetical protein